MNFHSIMQYIGIAIVLIAQIVGIIFEGFDYRAVAIIALCISLAVEIKGGDALRNNHEVQG